MDSCKKLMPRETEWYTEWVHTGKDKNYKYSPILPLIKVLNNLDSKVNLRRK